jgi:hypothetical protein
LEIFDYTTSIIMQITEFLFSFNFDYQCWFRVAMKRKYLEFEEFSRRKIKPNLNLTIRCFHIETGIISKIQKINKNKNNSMRCAVCW